jgi:hypothetical protein
VEPSKVSSFMAGAPPPLPVVTGVQLLSGLHKYRFSPSAASVLKKTSPVEHVAGTAVPAFIGLVESAFDASQLPAMVRLPIVVL